MNAQLSSVPAELSVPIAIVSSERRDEPPTTASSFKRRHRIRPPSIATYEYNSGRSKISFTKTKRCEYNWTSWNLNYAYRNVVRSGATGSAGSWTPKGKTWKGRLLPLVEVGVRKYWKYRESIGSRAAWTCLLFKTAISNAEMWK